MRYVGLLRGINVGGRNRLAMADLRAAVEVVGGREVVTYIQSGNVVFDADADLADAIEAEVLRSVGVSSRVVALAADRFLEVADANPFLAEAAADPKLVHVVFRRSAPTGDEEAALQAAASRAAAKGSPDRLAVAAGCAYLHTAGGLGRSVLAAELAKVKGDPGTARNVATVDKLRALL